MPSCENGFKMVLFKACPKCDWGLNTCYVLRFCCRAVRAGRVYGLSGISVKTEFFMLSDYLTSRNGCPKQRNGFLCVFVTLWLNRFCTGGVQNKGIRCPKCLIAEPSVPDGGSKHPSQRDGATPEQGVQDKGIRCPKCLIVEPSVPDGGSKHPSHRDGATPENASAQVALNSFVYCMELSRQFSALDKRHFRAILKV